MHWVRWAIAVAFGAAVIHIVEYHLAIGFNGNFSQRMAAIEYALYRCPLRGPLGLIVLLALFAIVATLASMRSQIRALHQLGGQLPSVSRMGHAMALRSTKPKCSKLATAWIILGLAQLGVFLVALHFVPMSYVMQMHGVHMVMGVAPPIAPALLSFLVALPGAFLVSMVEEKLRAIAEAIVDRVRAMYARARSSCVPRLRQHACP